MIRAYPRRPSVARGGTLVLHVATDAPRFRVRFARWADGFVPLGETEWCEGVDAPERDPAVDWEWPAYPFAIPPSWPSGVYVAHLEDGETLPLDLALDRAAALFVVRGQGSAPVLYKLAVATYHAYNLTGGRCFYVNPPRSSEPPGSKVSWRRPGGGIGGIVHGAPDPYDARSPRSSFAHFDAPFVRWLAREDVDVEYCVDLDVHEDPAILAPYRLVLNVGHDEYWSERMRDALEAYVARGGNAAFFGANLCWWRVHIVDGGTAMVSHQGGPDGARDQWWAPHGAARPEDALTGVSYRHGGGWWDGARTTRGFIVHDAEHWAFAGTGLRRGDAFGRETGPPLVGYECDGVPLASFDAQTGDATLAADAQRNGTPHGFRPLAIGPLDASWQELPPREGQPAGAGIHSATMGIFARGAGTTFTTGTTDWPILLDRDPLVARITRNVLDRLASPRVLGAGCTGGGFGEQRETAAGARAPDQGAEDQVPVPPHAARREREGEIAAVVRDRDDDADQA
jgi:hypothetical protein